uniref:Peptidase_S8 domain-containing protein n=1 Tax=Thelazia callipaeda TaxID=103827 RepID=A0A0N5CK37_THECL
LQFPAYIVSYDGYYNSYFRYSIIKEVLEIVVNIEPRPLLFSDFDVIELLSQKRRFDGTEIHQITKLVQIEKLWNMGFRGKGVKVAVFDTGLNENHPHFRNIIERTDWTNEQTADDGLGHGTFITGVIASSDDKCKRFAPDASIYVYKLFTKKQVSFTSWFLDAFNHAIFRGINILNLSIGGLDFTDIPFSDKMWELTANDVILISAVGNEGPKYGTLNNPADQMNVIGVGGIYADSKIANFSSRGMTTWELPGYNTLGKHFSLIEVFISSPVVTGAVAVMLSGINKKSLWNPAVVKQALIGGATRLSNVTTMFEQGAGKMNILASFEFMRKYSPRITLSCIKIAGGVALQLCFFGTAFWKKRYQNLSLFNLNSNLQVTVLNGLGVSGRLIEEPVWEPFLDENGDLLNVIITYSDIFWPWSGYMAVIIGVKRKAYNYVGIASGRITVTVASHDYRTKLSTAQLLVKVHVIPTPPKNQRLLWDQYRNIRYPPGYIPHDNLRDKTNLLDWNTDHPHTNFKALYEHLRSNGYYIEVCGEPLTCVDLTQYSTYLIIDPEEEFFPSELEKLYAEVDNASLNVIVFADWYNASVFEEIKFMDDSTMNWWKPETGGSNLPVLNDFLAKWNISLSAQVLDGIATNAEIISNQKTNQLHEEAIFLYYKNSSLLNKSGFVAVFGDSTCLEIGNIANIGNCVFLLETLLMEGGLAESLRQSLELVLLNITTNAKPVYKKVPQCRLLRPAVSRPVGNVTLPLYLNRQHLLTDYMDVSEEENKSLRKLPFAQVVNHRCK